MEMAKTAARKAKSPRSSAASGKRQPLTRHVILKAALELVDTDGFDGLSMRRLGQYLNAGAMSIYHHFENKEELLDGFWELIDLEMREITDIENLPNMAADAAIRSYINTFRTVWKRHPKTFRVLAQRTIKTPERARRVEIFMNALLRSGLDKDSAILAYRAIFCFVSGFVLLENEGEKPFYTVGDLEREFEVGFDIVLAGIESQLRGQTSDLAKAKRLRRSARSRQSSERPDFGAL